MATVTATKTVKEDILEVYEASREARRIAMWEKFEKTRPKNVPLADEDIQEEVNMVRYGNKEGRDWAEEFKQRGLK